MVRRYEEAIEVRSAGAPGSGTLGPGPLGSGPLQSGGALGAAVHGSGGAGAGGGAEDADAPAAFLWRGRLYVVREVLEHWQERRPWWRDALDEAPCGGADPAPDRPDPAPDPAPDLLDGARERRVWRVTASAGRMAGTGVYDLGADHSPRQWRLLRVAD